MDQHLHHAPPAFDRRAVDADHPDLPMAALILGPRADVDADRGASAVEYGILIAGIAALVVAVIFAFSGTVTGLFQDTCTSITDVAATSSC